MLFPPQHEPFALVFSCLPGLIDSGKDKAWHPRGFSYLNQRLQSASSTISSVRTQPSAR